MQRPVNINKKNIYTFQQVAVLCLLSFFNSTSARGQICPPNIDFEKGDFSGWTCYTGFASNSGQPVLSPFNGGIPDPDRHVMYSANSGEVDPYGGFSVNCPNGSGHSIRLGNSEAGGLAEGISYEFTIPANQPVYSLIYHYAVVFQDPNHQQNEQPRMITEITNVTDNIIIDCSSFTFFPYGSLLPGFFEVSNPPDPTPIWCKNWSAVSINLDGMAGKTIRLFFKTSDCSFKKHFGYAYIDVNSECSSEFTGATYCPDDTAVSIIAPYGYQNYTWYNSTFTQVLGTQQIIYFNPPPPAGSIFAVELIPFDGYGCRDTLYAHMENTLTLNANAGPDVISCDSSRVYIGTYPKPGVNYSWNPSTWLNNPNNANPRANPPVTTEYELTVRSFGGGCVNRDTVIVKASFVDTSLLLKGKTFFCINTGDSAVLTVKPTYNIQWNRNGAPLSGYIQPSYKVNQSGVYHAVLINSDGCINSTRSEEIVIESPVPGIIYPEQYSIVNVPFDLTARNFGVSVEWEPSVWLNNPSIANPVFKAPAELEQLYNIIIKTAAGCTTVDNQLVKVIREVKVYVPTAFTPNNDGLNDFIKPITLGIRELKYFRIYNRGGQLVYDHQPNSLGWDGKIGGLPQSTAVYVWMLRGTGWDKKTYIQKGTITLIR